MKHFLFLAVAAIGLSLGNQSAQARSWRIHSNANVKPDFTSIKAAMDSNDVMPGDTLYLEPGCVLRGGQAIKKSVTVIGPGYNFSGAGSSTAVLYGGTGLDAIGVKIEGCIIEKASINATKCTVERCRITEVKHNSSGTSMASVLSCYITKCVNLFSSRNCTINNCIISGYVSNVHSSTISNNVIFGENSGKLLTSITNSTITNNIILNTKPGYVLDANQEPQFYKNYTIANNTLDSGNTITNNVLSTDAEHAFNDYPTNKFIGATPEDIFVMEGIGEEIYRLKAGSPAIGYGTGGYDCGVFSGAFPYVLSGRPRYIPYISDAVIPNQPTDGKLNVTLKIKSQNE